MIFQIFQITQKTRKASQDPEGFVQQQALGVLIGMLIGPFIFLLLFLVFLFLLSYTHLLGGPYGIARFFFWFLAIIYGTVGYLGYKAVVTIKRVISQQRKKMQTSQNKGKYREAEVVE